MWHGILFIYVVVCSSCALYYKETHPASELIVKAMPGIKGGENLLFETRNYRIFLHAEDQRYLGRSTVWLKRACGSISCLSQEEWRELHEVMKIFERAVEQAFGAAMVNWSHLMNHGQRVRLPMAILFPPTLKTEGMRLSHWHGIPRYRKPVIVGGIIFTDPNFGSHYKADSRRNFTVSEKVQKEIILRIQEHL